jgi:hypothetical protein
MTSPRPIRAGPLIGLAALPLLLTGAIAAPAKDDHMQPGMWQVWTWVPKAKAPRVLASCLRRPADWLHLALPILDDATCAIDRRAAGGPIDLHASCWPDGFLAITGYTKGDSFDLVARRVGTVGFRRGATATVMSQGKRISAVCAPGSTEGD